MSCPCAVIHTYFTLYLKLILERAPRPDADESARSRHPCPRAHRPAVDGLVAGVVVNFLPLRLARQWHPPAMPIHCHRLDLWQKRYGVSFQLKEHRTHKAAQTIIFGIYCNEIIFGCIPGESRGKLVVPSNRRITTHTQPYKILKMR